MCIRDSGTIMRKGNFGAQGDNVTLYMICLLYTSLTTNTIFFIKLMLYIEKCTAENRLPVKEHYYRYFFNTKFKLHFYVPKKDTCKTYDIFKNKLVTLI